jgi:hypothetical protein
MSFQLLRLTARVTSIFSSFTVTKLAAIPFHPLLVTFPQSTSPQKHPLTAYTFQSSSQCSAHLLLIMFNKAIHSTSRSPSASRSSTSSKLIRISSLSSKRVSLSPFFFSIGYDAKCWIQQFFYLPIQWKNSENIEILIAHSSAAFLCSVHHLTKIEISIFSQFNQHSSQNTYFIWSTDKRNAEQKKYDNEVLKWFSRNDQKCAVRIRQTQCRSEQISGVFICTSKCGLLNSVGIH